jgi:hypothetical protein
MTQNFTGFYTVIYQTGSEITYSSNVVQISIPVNMCICHLVAGCMNHVSSTGSSNTFHTKPQFFPAKMYSFIEAHRQDLGT